MSEGWQQAPTMDDLYRALGSLEDRSGPIWVHVEGGTHFMNSIKLLDNGQLLLDAEPPYEP